jgi:hypothetical protein
MKMLITGAALLAVLAIPATAENRHDRKLEQAAIDIAVAKIGELRGGFSYDAEPVRIMLPDFGSTGTITRKLSYAAPAKAVAGLLPAVERKIARIVF